MKEEKIVRALGLVQEKYIQEAAPGRGGRKKNNFAWWAAAAASLLLLLAAGKIIGGGNPALPGASETPAQSAAPTESAGTKPELNGSGVGTLHIMQTAPGTDVNGGRTPDFLIYVNQDEYCVRETEQGYVIEPLLKAEDLPPCLMEISWQGDVSVKDALAQQAEALAETMLSVGEPALSEDGARGWVHGSNGNNWDSEQADVCVMDDLQGGVFIATIRYFLEAAEGHGMRFADMLATFESVSLNAAPDWFRALYDAAMRLIPAILRNDLSGVDALLTDGAQISGYDADVYGDVSICCIDYRVDDDQNPGSAMISVRHRVNIEGGEYDYLSIEMVYGEGGWKAARAGIEP